MSIKLCAFSFKFNVFCIGTTLGDIFCLSSSIDSFILDSLLAIRILGLHSTVINNN